MWKQISQDLTQNTCHSGGQMQQYDKTLCAVGAKME